MSIPTWRISINSRPSDWIRSSRPCSAAWSASSSQHRLGRFDRRVELGERGKHRIADLALDPDLIAGGCHFDRTLARPGVSHPHPARVNGARRRLPPRCQPASHDVNGNHPRRVIAHHPCQIEDRRESRGARGRDRSQRPRAVRSCGYAAGHHPRTAHLDPRPAGRRDDPRGVRILAVWANRQVLNANNWADTSRRCCRTTRSEPRSPISWSTRSTPTSTSPARSRRAATAASAARRTGRRRPAHGCPEGGVRIARTSPRARSVASRATA